jgi:ubiquitin carboxyl-terminal hydrolase 22/27/51
MFNMGQEVINTSIQHYKMILRSIFDNNTVVPQTSKAADGQPLTSLTSNYLCLQCPVTVTEEERIKHGSKKQHRFCTLPVTVKLAVLLLI